MAHISKDHEPPGAGFPEAWSHEGHDDLTALGLSSGLRTKSQNKRTLSSHIDQSGRDQTQNSVSYAF